MATLTPEYIQGKLFSFHDIAHKLHLDTRSFSEHKALYILYNELVTFKDDISELLMGYMGGKRIGAIKIDDIPEYSHAACVKLANDIKTFAYDLEMWAEDKKYCDIENTAQSLSGLSAKIIYLLTLT